MFVRNQWTATACDSNVVSNQQSFTDQAIDHWSQSQRKHWTFAMGLLFHRNKLTYVSFHKVGWKQPSGEVGNFVAVLLQIYFSRLSVCQKLTKYNVVWQSYCKNKRVQFFAPQCSATSNDMKLVHWPFMGGLLHLVQRGGNLAAPQPAQAPTRCTKCNSPPINGQCTNHRIAV